MGSNPTMGPNPLIPAMGPTPIISQPPTIIKKFSMVQTHILEQDPTYGLNPTMPQNTPMGQSSILG